MNIKPIKNEADYEAALTRIDELMDADENTDELDELEVLSILVEKYEDEHYPIDPPDPVEAIIFRMEQMGITKSDLAEILGTRSRVSEVLNRKRGLSLKMIRNINSTLHIPIEILIRE